MKDLTEFQCPSCGGKMEFDAATQKLKCPYCDTILSIEEYNALHPQEQPQATQNEWSKEEIGNLVVYTCQSCGGEIMTDATTGATTCPFCSSPVVMNATFSGSLRPDYVIPFKKSKQEAKQSYFKHLEGKSFLPSVFKDENHIDEIKGVYVPFWVYDLTVEGDMEYDGTILRSWSDSEYDYTETNHFDVVRTGDVDYEKIPCKASSHMDTALMESIEPYDFKDAEAFKKAFLAGYYANRYDISQEKGQELIQERIQNSTRDVFRESLSQYAATTPMRENISIKRVRPYYVLYPVWLLNTTWNDEHYQFAMNGQTGKFVGNLPADNAAFFSYVVKTAIPCAIVIFILMLVFFS